MLGAAHGVIGAVGLAALLWALRAPRDATRGTATFGWDAAVLLGVALAGGIAILILARLRHGRGLDLALVLHGTVAVIGYVILAAFVS
jgi:hypothetical protein